MEVKGLPVKTLAAAFQQAIAVTRKLGKRRLWIDCFRVLQGYHHKSRNDFQKEALKMQDYYGNSYCNISATGALNHTGNLFNYRDPKTILPIEVIPPPEDMSSQKYYAVLEDMVKRNISNASINHRAWVIQERVLSP